MVVWVHQIHQVMMWDRPRVSSGEVVPLSSSMKRLRRHKINKLHEQVVLSASVSVP